MQDYSLKIAETIEDFLRADDWKFDPVDENGVIRFSVSLKCKFRRCNVAIQVRNTCFMVLATLPLTADEESRPNVLEYLNRANYGLIRGGFEMDMADGEVRYRTSQYCGDEDVLISHETVKDTLYVSLSMLERYGTAMLEVMLGNLEPAEAIEQAEHT
ncbi:MAG: YbjN domain-containing protein [Oscillospiraceae bacterium]|jgi:hypothetical protein|nr:YbjN domain-containing protein [Oscillospiraceae bacterium]MCR5305879.1 YbjN domain-containing protein [Oscillospiraceae bacterium]